MLELRRAAELPQLCPTVVHHMTLFLEVLEDGWINWIKIQNPEREAMNTCFVGSGFCICEMGKRKSH